MKARQQNPDAAFGKKMFEEYQKWIRGTVAEEAAKPEVKNSLRHVPSTALDLVPAISFSGYEKDRLFYNLGDGRFEDVGPVLGAGRIEDGRSVAMFDFDRDGALDILEHGFYKHPVILLRNELRPANWIAIRGRVGARVKVETSKGTLVKEIACGSGYLTGTPPEVYFAFGDAELKRVTIDGKSFELEPRKVYVAGKEGVKALDLKPGKLQVPEKPANRAPRVGDTLDLTAKDTQGKEQRIPGGGVVYVFDPDCFVCREEFSRWKDHTVTLLSLDADVADVVQFLKRHGATQLCLLIDEAARSKVDASTPVAYVLDAQRRITAKFAGRHALDDALKFGK